MQLWKFALLVLTGMMVAASNLISSDTEVLNFFDPAGNISEQVVAVSTGRFIARSNGIQSSEVEVKAPTLTVDLDQSIKTVVSELEDTSQDLEEQTLLALNHLQGTYGHIELPNKLTKEYLASLPMPSGDAEFKCLSEALYFEARGETLQGQRAVAEVILNRVKSSHYPNTICGVVNQGTGKTHQCQFSYTCDGVADVIREKEAYENSAKIARLMIDGLYEQDQLTGGALYYHTTAVRPKWTYKKTQTAQLGTHLFYR